MLQLLLVRSVREEALASLTQSDAWFGKKQCQCCTVKCEGKQPYQQRTLLEGAELHNCRIEHKGEPYKLAGKWVETSEQMDSLFFKKRSTSDPLVKFPKSDYMCEEICDAQWPPTNMRPRSLWNMSVKVYRSGGVEGPENACASIYRVKPAPKRKKVEKKEKKSNGFFSKVFKGKGKK